MNLREITYQEDYRSGHDDILNSLLRPSLRSSSRYWRAVGYFSSSALESFGSPLGDFVSNGGHIRLITSVELSQDDISAIEAGMDRAEVCSKRLEEIIEQEFRDNTGSGTARLAKLLELERLEIRIAIPRTGTGIYHEKIGLFFDRDNFVAFSGSSNESRSAFENNRECIDVYTSWSSPSRATRKLRHFEEVWEGTDRGVYVFNFPEAARSKLIRIAEENSHRAHGDDFQPNRWRHQDDAVKLFLEHERGILNMATGTGKTRTALRIMKTLFAARKITTAIITMDGNDLLEQWRREILTEISSIGQPLRLLCDFNDYREAQQFILDPEGTILLISRAVGKTRDPLSRTLDRLRPETAQHALLVHDEVHRLGSPMNRKRLLGRSTPVRYRLGLSATPERDYDQAGSDFIEKHIGPIIFTFGLDDAIRRGVLAPFTYHPIAYELTDDDRGRLRNVYKMRSARAAAGNAMTNEEVWTELAKVYKTSPAKLPLFDDFISVNQNLLQRCIVFTETQDYGMEVIELLHRYRHDFHTYFTGEERGTLERFARGELECLVTCHRLSEGIDIKTLNTVILFSSARARLETIQRMGRCLRINPANPTKIAHVVDFIRSANTGEDDQEERSATADDLRMQWLMELSDIRPEEAF
jgi:superfamily II DNA or RNA helicase/HKD family nuclease